MDIKNILIRLENLIKVLTYNKFHKNVGIALVFFSVATVFFMITLVITAGALAITALNT